MCERIREPRRRARRPGAALAAVLLLAAVSAGADEGRRDPLQPPSFERERTQSRFNASAWQLASTLVSDERRVARINGQSVRPGDWVGGAQVRAIERGRVRLDYRGRTFTIRRSVPEIRRDRGS